MCHKVIATYQQTFQNNDPNVNKPIFRFNRIYKSKPEQFFRVKCVSLSSVPKYAADTKICGEMYLTGLQAFNKNCNFKSETEEDNRLYLGDLNGIVPDCHFIVDSIPLDNFTIFNNNFEGIFTACFHIELIEP
jgi:hypothetical protein